MESWCKWDSFHMGNGNNVKFLLILSTFLKILTQIWPIFFTDPLFSHFYLYPVLAKIHSLNLKHSQFYLNVLKFHFYQYKSTWGMKYKKGGGA